MLVFEGANIQYLFYLIKYLLLFFFVKTPLDFSSPNLQNYGL